MRIDTGRQKRSLSPQDTVIGRVRELIQLHEDRVNLYHQALLAVTHAEHMELKAILGELIRESLECQQELKDSLARLGGRIQEPEEGHKAAVYRVWETEKGPISGESPKAILESCERESEAMRRAYEAVLSAGDTMNTVLSRRLHLQVIRFRRIEDRIREYHKAL
jgi:uncharacterized protein (TIGR02284 family)